MTKANFSANSSLYSFNPLLSSKQEVNLHFMPHPLYLSFPFALANSVASSMGQSSDARMLSRCATGPACMAPTLYFLTPRHSQTAGFERVTENGNDDALTWTQGGPQEGVSTAESPLGSRDAACIFVAVIFCGEQDPRLAVTWDQGPEIHSGGQAWLLQACTWVGVLTGQRECSTAASFWKGCFWTHCIFRLCWPPAHGRLHTLHSPGFQLSGKSKITSNEAQTWLVPSKAVTAKL